MDEKLFVANWKEIKEGKVSDVYFHRAKEIILKKGLDKRVKMEVRAGHLHYPWAVFCGLPEVLNLLEDLPVNVWAMEEGTVFFEDEPVLLIEGNYSEFGVFETALLGFLCQASGISTKAARCKKAAGDKIVLSFGARRIHPAISPMVERSAFIGGCDGVAVVKSAEILGEKPVGTMPHALILLAGDEIEAFLAFDEIMEEEILRIALVDTFGDEKFVSLKAAESLGKKLYGVRLDTPSSRRGNFLKILEEVKWELNLRGYSWVKIFVSGGIDEYKIMELNPVADGYGVGTSIANAPVIDFSLDIVEIEEKPIAKKGKKSGAKQVWRCWNCLKDRVSPWKGKEEICENCGNELSPLLIPVIQNGKIVYTSPSPQKIREKVLVQIKKLKLDND